VVAATNDAAAEFWRGFPWLGKTIGRLDGVQGILETMIIVHFGYPAQLYSPQHGAEVLGVVLFQWTTTTTALSRCIFSWPEPTFQLLKRTRSKPSTQPRLGLYEASASQLLSTCSINLRTSYLLSLAVPASRAIYFDVFHHDREIRLSYEEWLCSDLLESAQP
jgi:hypothetical protein